MLGCAAAIMPAGGQGVVVVMVFWQELLDGRGRGANPSLIGESKCRFLLGR